MNFVYLVFTHIYLFLMFRNYIRLYLNWLLINYCKKNRIPSSTIVYSVINGLMKKRTIFVLFFAIKVDLPLLSPSPHLPPGIGTWYFPSGNEQTYEIWESEMFCSLFLDFGPLVATDKFISREKIFFFNGYFLVLPRIS